jgi:diguanylate cyclase (GGDEF)-like protein
MRSSEKDYRYLLQNLIPHSRLFPSRRHEIEKALSVGSEEEVRREAVLTLEELVRTSYLNREHPISSGGYMSVVYSKTSGGYRFLVRVPIDEWNDLIQEDAKAKKDTRARGGTGPLGEEETSTIEAFPKLIRAFLINEKNGSILLRLNTLAKRLSSWLRLSALRIYIMEERVGEKSEEKDFVTIVPESDFTNSLLYRRIESRRYEEAVVYETASGLSKHRTDNAETMACTPIFALGEFWGILEVGLAENHLDQAARAKMLTAAAIVRQIIENSVRLENLVFIDKLTGIYNRHFYDTQIPIEIERATRSGNKLSMLLLDIDDFKSINDKLGHKKGDEALVLVADLIKKNLRKIDLPFRYGGEEFVILLPGTAQLEAIHTAERLRSVINDCSTFLDNERNPRRITVSAGIAVFPDDAVDGENLFIRADTAMLKAKKLGKNRVELYKK